MGFECQRDGCREDKGEGRTPPSAADGERISGLSIGLVLCTCFGLRTGFGLKDGLFGLTAGLGFGAKDGFLAAAVVPAASAWGRQNNRPFGTFRRIHPATG